MSKLPRCKIKTRRNKKTGKCEPYPPANKIKMSLSKYFEIVKLLLDTSTIYVSYLDEDQDEEEEEEEPVCKIMPIHMINAFKILGITNQMDKSQINHILFMMKNVVLQHTVIKKQPFTETTKTNLKNEMQHYLKLTDSCFIDDMAIVYFWVIKGLVPHSD